MSTKIAKNQRSRRQLEAKQPKLIENTKALIGIKGPKTSEVVATVLKDLHKFKQPESKLLTKRNITRPFEDISSVEFLGKVNDSSLFSYGSHSKKRPHNLVIGRLFDFQLLDMFELGVNGETFQSMDAFDGLRKAVVRVGSKPAILFQGDLWDSNSDLVMLRNLFLDFFRGETLSKINLSALDRVIILTVTSAAPNTLPVIHFRHYGVALKKSSSSLPRVELEEVGPRMDLTLRRRKSGSEQLVKESLRQPRQTTKTIFQKNIERNAMGDRMGRVHMQKQDLSNLYVAKLKGLKKRKRSDDADHNGADGGAAEPDENGMTDVDTPASSSRSSSTSRRPSSAPSSSAPRRMSTSHDSMDEFASRATTNQTGRPRTSTVDKNLQKKKAGGFGSKPIEGGYRNVAKKKKLDK